MKVFKRECKWRTYQNVGQNKWQKLSMTIASCQQCQINKRKTFQKGLLFWPDYGFVSTFYERPTFGMGQSVARYVCLLAPLTLLTCSAALARSTLQHSLCSPVPYTSSLTSPIPSWDSRNSWICVHAVNAIHENTRNNCHHWKYALTSEWQFIH